jgi:hypothetical protein
MKYTTLSEDDMDVVQKFAFGGIANPSQRATLRASDREYLAARQKELDAFEEQRQAYNTGLAKYQEEVYNPYQQQAQAYNAAAKQYNTEVYEPYQQQYGEYEKAIKAFNEGDRTADYAGPSEPVLAKQFEMKAPTTPGGFDMSAPVLPFKEEDVQARQQQAAQTAQRDAGNRATAINVASNPEQFGFGSMSVNSQFLAEGGPVNKDSPYGPGGRAQFEANLAAQEEFSRGDNPAPAQQSAAQQLADFVGPRAGAPEMGAPQAQTAAAELGRMSFGPQTRTQAPVSDPALTLYSQPPGTDYATTMPVEPPSSGTRRDFGFTRDPDEIGTMEMIEWRNAKTGETYMGSGSADRPPSADWTRVEPTVLPQPTGPAPAPKPQLSDAITQLKGNDKQSAEDTMRAIVGLPPLQRAAPAPMPEKPELSDAITRLKGNDKQGAEDIMRAIVGLPPIDRTGGKPPAVIPQPVAPAPTLPPPSGRLPPVVEAPPGQVLPRSEERRVGKECW